MGNSVDIRTYPRHCVTGSEKYKTLELRGSGSDVNGKLLELSAIHGELNIVRCERYCWGWQRVWIVMKKPEKE